MKKEFREFFKNNKITILKCIGWCGVALIGSYLIFTFFRVL